MSNYQTIRKNSLKRIRALLKQAVLIREYSDHETHISTDRRTVEQAMAFATGEFCRRVRLQVDAETGEPEELSISAGHWWHFTAYMSVAAAKRNLTRHAFDKYFSEEEQASAPADVQHPEEVTRTQAAPPAPSNAVDLQAQLEFAQARHRGLCAEMMDVFAMFATLQHGAAKLADISAQVAAAEAEVKELTVQLLELTSIKCQPTRARGRSWRALRLSTLVGCWTNR